MKPSSGRREAKPHYPTRKYGAVRVPCAVRGAVRGARCDWRKRRDRASYTIHDNLLITRLSQTDATQPYFLPTTPAPRIGKLSLSPCFVVRGTRARASRVAMSLSACSSRYGNLERVRSSSVVGRARGGAHGPRSRRRPGSSGPSGRRRVPRLPPGPRPPSPRPPRGRPAGPPRPRPAGPRGMPPAVHASAWPGPFEFCV